MRYLLILLLFLLGCTAKDSTQSDNTDMTNFFDEIYANFNSRNIDFVINNMTQDVKWANGMEGGFVYGHDGVREYWTRQFKIVSSNVTPLEVRGENGTYRIKVHQVVHDLEGKLLADQEVTHVFKLHDGKIAEFEIEK